MRDALRKQPAGIVGQLALSVVYNDEIVLRAFGFGKMYLSHTVGKIRFFLPRRIAARSDGGGFVAFFHWRGDVFLE
jgi:hypothetical protein